MDDYKIIIYRRYFQCRLVSLLTYVKLLEGAAGVLQHLHHHTTTTTIVYGGIAADNLPVKVFSLYALTKVVHWSLCGY